MASVPTSTAVDARPTVAAQGGVLEGMDPTHYDSKQPIVLFIIQAVIIIVFCRVLHWPLSKIRQPRVIAEVIGGIILGPSVMSRIPHFEQTIFPKESLTNLNLVANLGLLLFLFLVGLEVNMRVFTHNWRVALSVGLAGMILPFGLGGAIAYGLYHQFRNDPDVVDLNFGVYLLFIGTALSITAFPVLCRILTELKLLGSDVGVTVLAAGVGNDVVGWILLALCVALVNNNSGLAALYVLLTSIGYILFLVYLIRPAFIWVLRRQGAIQNGPSQGMITLTLLLVLASSWFTAIIGIHAIFGAFVIGLICPHEGGFPIKVTEKIEDIVTVLFLPLYFALSGLNTNIGLLQDGITWAYVVGVCAIAFAGKIIGGTLAARANKLVWRESLTIGVLMSCKGLVELIVLNIGLQARILSKRTFTIFVVMALITTFATTPLVTWLYPPSYQKKLEAWKRGEIDWDGNRIRPGSADGSEDGLEKASSTQVRKLLVYLRLDSLPSLFTFIALLGGDRNTVVTKTHRAKAELEPVPEASEGAPAPAKRPLEVHGLRMIELSERTSSVMRESEMEDYTWKDPVVNAFRTFAQLNNVAVSGSVSVVSEASFVDTLTNQASEHLSDLVLIPWTLPDAKSNLDMAADSFSASLQDTFVRGTLDTATCNTAIFFNRGFGGAAGVSKPEPRVGLTRTTSGISLRSQREPALPPAVDRSHHVFFPFFGGVDDRVALRFVLQLAQNSNITVTITHFTMAAALGSKEANMSEGLAENSSGTSVTGQPALQGESASDAALLHTLRDSLPTALTNRVVFVDVSTTTPLAECLDCARREIAQSPRNAGDLVVVGRGRHAILAAAENSVPTSNLEMKRTLGVVAENIISGGVRGSVLVMQAGGQHLKA